MRMLICAGIGLLLVCGASMAPADLVETLDAHYAAVNALDVTPDGSTLFSAGKEAGRAVGVQNESALDALLAKAGK